MVDNPIQPFSLGGLAPLDSYDLLDLSEAKDAMSEAMTSLGERE